MGIVIDTTDVDYLTTLFEVRARDMVPGAVREGKYNAEAYANMGGRSKTRQQKAVTHFATGRRMRRAWHATAVMTARMTEHAMYQRLRDFFGNWV